MILLYVGIFVGSCVLLGVSGNWLVTALSRIAHFLNWREFVVSFFLMSFATSIPEFLVGIGAALGKIPELSFGNIIGQNIIHFTLAIAICVFILKELDVESRVAQSSAMFTGIIALLPLLLILDGNLSRIDGIILILSFVGYAVWMFSKKEHFSKVYQSAHIKSDTPFLSQVKNILKDIGLFIVSGAALVISSQGIISSSTFFAEYFSLPLVIVGVLIVGLGTALPETYFSIASARKGNSWMLVGNLLGATVVSSTLVLGLVAIISPIIVSDFSPYLINRIFLLLSAAFFVIFLRTGEKITRKEGVALLLLYLLFITVEMAKNF